VVTVRHVFLDLDTVPFLYFSRQKFVFRKNLIDTYLLDSPEIVHTFDQNVTSLSAFVAR
jgi:hypothetical protein